MTGLISSDGLLGSEATALYEFKIQESRDRQYYWTLHNTRGNTEPVAMSEMYTSKQSAQHSIDQVKRFALSALVTDLTS